MKLKSAVGDQITEITRCADCAGKVTCPLMDVLVAFSYGKQALGRNLADLCQRDSFAGFSNLGEGTVSLNASCGGSSTVDWNGTPEITIIPLTDI